MQIDVNDAIVDVPAKGEWGSMVHDTVDHPHHYKQGKYETIDVIDSMTGMSYHSYYVGNIIKYISRYKFKNGIEDLKKARWYLDRLIAKMEERI